MYFTYSLFFELNTGNCDTFRYACASDQYVTIEIHKLKSLCRKNQNIIVYYQLNTTHVNTAESQPRYIEEINGNRKGKLKMRLTTDQNGFSVKSNVALVLELDQIIKDQYM